MAAVTPPVESGTPVASSAPGKVLMVGGYLVLERPHFGLVLSSSARFYAAAQPLPLPVAQSEGNDPHRNGTGHAAGTPTEENAEGSGDREREGKWGADGEGGSLRVRVRSPQMRSAYTFRVILPSLAISPDSGGSVAAGGGGGSTGNAPPSRNPFVERAVQLTLALALYKRHPFSVHTVPAPSDAGPVQELLKQGLDLVLLGDNDFYSHRHTLKSLGLPLSPASLASIPRFSPVVEAPTANGTPGVAGTPGDAGTAGAPPEGAKAAVAAKLEKTGLGSSAAMTAAVCSALLAYWGVVRPEPSGKETALVHRVAQAAHCFGQGKVGSGFDIAAAIFGPVKYVRFSPACLEPLMSVASGGGAAVESGEGAQEPEWMRLASALWGTGKDRGDRGGVGEGSDLGDEFWDYEVTPFALPPGLHLLVGETGGGGTSTPSMLSAIKRWRAESGKEAAATWQRLASANAAVADSLERLQALSVTDPSGYRSAVTLCSTTRPAQWGESSGVPPATPGLGPGAADGAAQGPSKETVAALLQLRTAFKEVRAMLQLISRAAEVPIEPLQQTEMLDETMALDGVVLSGVPGAGGYDAIFAVALGEAAVGRVADFWSQHSVVPLGSGVSDSVVEAQSRGIESVVVTTLAPWLKFNDCSS